MDERRETDPPRCPVCGREWPEFQVEEPGGRPLGCEHCLTIRRRGVIQI